VNFGDGIQDTGISVTHRYAGSGRFVITLTVTDMAGGQGAHAANVPVERGHRTRSRPIASPWSYFAKPCRHARLERPEAVTTRPAFGE